MKKHNAADVNSRTEHSHWPASLELGTYVLLSKAREHTYGGIAEDTTTDGTIIWIRTDLNERKLFHFQDGYSAQIINPSPTQDGQAYTQGPSAGYGRLIIKAHTGSRKQA